MGEKVGIVGSRKWMDRAAVEQVVGRLEPGTIVVSGGCRGVDTWAAEAARARGLQVIEYRPEDEGPMTSYSECCRAYAMRNRRIAETADRLIAFVVPGHSRGTNQTIEAARRLGKHVDEVTGGAGKHE